MVFEEYALPQSTISRQLYKLRTQPAQWTRPMRNEECHNLEYWIIHIYHKPLHNERPIQSHSHVPSSIIIHPESDHGTD